MESKFGWLLSGPIQNENNHVTNNDLNTLCQRVKYMPVEESKLDNLLTKFWEISIIPEEISHKGGKAALVGEYNREI